MRQRKPGFTLIELLVVITIIGMLVGLLMPAVQSARESGRRAQCLNNQRQISLGLLGYEGERGAFPGYVGEYRGYIQGQSEIKQRKISWWVSILPQLDRMDLHELWKDITLAGVSPVDTSKLPGDNTVADNPIPGVYMKLAVCPNNTPPTQNESWLSYRVNVGGGLDGPRPNTFGPGNNDPRIPAEGVFTDQYQDDFNDPANAENLVRVGLGYITSKDGSSTTLMLAENAASVPPQNSFSQEGKWAPLIQNPGMGGPSPKRDRANIWNDPNPDNALILGFNWGGMDPADPNDPALPKPNEKIFSNHPGGVVVSFCDGHQSFLRTDIEPIIYIQLMCPHDRGVPILDPPPATKFAPPLDEGKF
ncbi:MAG TPA: DUF1559 domain-containing protein [Thermoguttaceae bacterium]